MAISKKKSIKKTAKTKPIKIAKKATKSIEKKRVSKSTKHKIQGITVRQSKAPVKRVVKSGYTTKSYNGDNYVERDGIFVHVDMPVAPEKIEKGIKKARSRIKKLMEALPKTLSKEYSIDQIELTLGFGAKGEFLGIGGSANASVKIIAVPKNKS